jgi:acylphosphatase
MSTDHPASTVQATVRYRGTVQGVGFRMTAVRIASRFEVGGCVENRPDGSVQLVAVGEKDEVKRFLDAVSASSLGGYITDRNLAWGPPSERFEHFSIRP